MPPETDDDQPPPIAVDAPSAIPAQALAMALEEPTSNPVQPTTATGTISTVATGDSNVSDTVAPPPTDYDANKPPKPIMGDLVALSKTEWSAWTGGKPIYTWTGLDPSARIYHTSPNQLRPPLASSAQKGYNYRRTGLTKDLQFHPKSDLAVFQNAIWKHLRNTGMDTISYLPDPEDPTKMVSVVTNHARFTLLTAKKLGAAQVVKYDSYDATNDDAARTFLLASLNQALSNKIEERLDDDDPFFVVWLEFIKTIQSTSV